MSPAAEDILVLEGHPAIFRSDAGRKLMSLVQRVAPHPTAVLIVGETGSGKELVARALHHFSLRNHKPWIDVNCAAIPEHLIESELFGYEKGAFSGADQTKPGFFEMADQGTLFLDEIGELEPRVQVKLLRVLDGAPYFRLGGNKKISVNVRVVAATNRELEKEVGQGKFRRDLYHRLSQIQLIVPPLRTRKEDIEAIAEYFLTQQKPGALFSPEAITALKNFPWPGNVRELKNVVTKAALMTDPEELNIGINDLPPEVAYPFEAAGEAEKTAGTAVAAAVGTSAEDEPTGDLDAMEKRMIVQALKRFHGDQTKASEQLGISRRTLTRKLKAYALDAESMITSSPSSGPLGKLSYEKAQSYRAEIEFPLVVNGTNFEQTITAVNISSRGLGFKSIVVPPIPTGEMQFTFVLPGTEKSITAKGDITWLDSAGRGGARFGSVGDQAALDRWLAQQLAKEGWANRTV